MDPVVPVVVSTCAVVIAILNLVHTRFQVEAKLREDISALVTETKVHEDDLSELKSTLLGKDYLLHEFEEIRRRLTNVESHSHKIPAIEDKVNLFWSFVQSEFPKLLIHEGEPERDVLLMKLSNNKIRLHELEHLQAIIDNEFEHMENKQGTEAVLNRINAMVIKKCLTDPRDP